MMASSQLTIEKLQAQLTELALDLRWTWDHATNKIWRELDPVLWEQTQNPLVVLQTVSKDRINEALADPLVREIIEELTNAKRQHSLAPAWFQHTYPGTALTGVAYFSMEFMLSEALPIYSGGLGNVAGDLLKTASDLGVPVYGIGLLFQQGYSRQVIYSDGSQQYVTPFNDPGQLPVTPLRDTNGEWVRIEIKLPGYSVWLRTWKVQVGRVNLFLLDSNDAANFPVHRGITNELYGGDATMRLLQQLILGIGGWRLVKALHLQPQIVHLNEGHTAFAVLERAASLMKEMPLSFEEALTISRSGNIFTTHTAIGAGFDCYESALLEHYLGDYTNDELKISFSDLLALGRKNPDDNTEPFNTAFLAIRGSRQVNGVSRLHANVSRRLFASLFQRWPLEEIPIRHVTNGVHMSTWDSPEADKLWTETCGKDRWLQPLDELSQRISAVSDARLWEMRVEQKKSFVAYLRYRYAQQLSTIGMPSQEVEAARIMFDPNLLTIGFARRFASYKRPGLLLKNPTRLKRILLNEERPVQLVLAGKAHSGDAAGQALIQQWVQFIWKENLQHKIVFLSDYDMHLSEHMVQGVDLWINTPLRPWEACGTSGMKVLVNGGLNFSELDGWWDEAYKEACGWAIGDRRDHENDLAWDTTEAEQLYTLLEEQVIPAYYTCNDQGIPLAWVSKMRQSMAYLTPQLSSNRSLREYVETYYLPAAATYLERVANNGEKGKAIARWKNELEEGWPNIRFGEVCVHTQGSSHVFSAQVHLGQVSANSIKVEIYADKTEDRPAEKYELLFNVMASDQPSTAVFSVSIPACRPAADYTPRVTLRCGELAIPQEVGLILWQR
jgi:starch phosphorylase